jgi:hypothetical protein
MIRKALLVLVVSLAVASVAMAQEGPVGVVVTTTVASQYNRNGFDVVKGVQLQDGAVVQPNVTMGVKNTGFNAFVGGSFVMNDNSELHEASYGVNFVKAASPLVTVGAGYTFFDNRVDHVGGVVVPDNNTHEVWGSVELNSAVGVKPGVTVKYEKPTVAGQDGYEVVVGGLKYALPLSGVSVGGAGVDLNWSTGVVYNSGVKVDNVVVVKSGVSAVQFGVASALHAGRVVVTPAVNYQVTVENTVSKDNSFWATFGVAYGF